MKRRKAEKGGENGRTYGRKRKERRVLLRA